MLAKELSQAIKSVERLIQTRKCIVWGDAGMEGISGLVRHATREIMGNLYDEGYKMPFHLMRVKGAMRKHIYPSGEETWITGDCVSPRLSVIFGGSIHGALEDGLRVGMEGSLEEEVQRTVAEELAHAAIDTTLCQDFFANSPGRNDYESFDDYRNDPHEILTSELVEKLRR